MYIFSLAPTCSICQLIVCNQSVVVVSVSGRSGLDSGRLSMLFTVSTSASADLGQPLKLGREYARHLLFIGAFIDIDELELGFDSWAVSSIWMGFIADGYVKTEFFLSNLARPQQLKNHRIRGRDFS